MKIQVTREDIDKAREQMKTEGASTCCPIAQACKRKFGNEFIGVGKAWISLQQYFIFLPKPAVEFIRDFDKKHEVQPIEFEVEA